MAMQNNLIVKTKRNHTNMYLVSNSEVYDFPMSFHQRGVVPGDQQFPVIVGDRKDRQLLHLAGS